VIEGIYINTKTAGGERTTLMITESQRGTNNHWPCRETFPIKFRGSEMKRQSNGKVSHTFSNRRRSPTKKGLETSSQTQKEKKEHWSGRKKPRERRRRLLITAKEGITSLRAAREREREWIKKWKDASTFYDREKVSLILSVENGEG